MMTTALRTVILLGVHTISNAQEYTLGEWHVTGALNVATTQFYGAVDESTNTAYVTGGLVSDQQASNNVESVTFDVQDDALTISSDTEQTFYASELGLNWELSSYFGKQQSAGFYDHHLFVIEPIYSTNPDENYFLKCDVESQICSFEPTQHLTAKEPCITQQDQYLYVVGGIDESTIGASSHINVYSMENDEWFINPFGALEIGQLYHSCAVCGDYLYTFGGDIGSDGLNNSETYTGVIQKCDLEGTDGGACTILDISYNNVRYSRATTINEDVIVLAGGQYSASEYSFFVDIFDCRTEEMIGAPDILQPLTDFQMQTVFNDSFVCLFGGQSVSDDTFEISDEIVCAPVIQDGVSRYRSLQPETTTTTLAPETTSVPTEPNTPQTTQNRQTVEPTFSPTEVETTIPPTLAPEEVIENNSSVVNGETLYDEFENESNSNAAVIYGTIAGIVVCAIGILIVVISRSRRGRKDNHEEVQPNDDSFVVNQINADSDDLGVGHSHKIHHGSHIIVESTVGSTDESDEDIYAAQSM
eukprot:302540_1